MPDTDIIELFWNRIEQAISRLDEKYGRYFMTIAVNVLRSREDSEECVNDTYMDTWNAIPPTRPDNLKIFVGRITRNNALNLYEKKHAKKRGGGEQPTCLDELAEVVSGRDTLQEKEDYDHAVRCINAFLAGQKEEQRIIFVQRYWYKCPVAQIAQQLQVGESKVKMTLSRMRSALKDYLETEGVHV